MAADRSGAPAVGPDHPGARLSIERYGMAAPLLIVGGDGTVATALAAHLTARGIGFHATTRRAPRPDRPFLDLAAESGFELADAGYGSAVICAAVARLAACAADPAGSRAVNVTGTAALARRLAANGTRVLYLSTDKVFDGTRPRRRADEPTCPATEYGRQKAEAEAAVLALPGGTVLRLSKVIHPGMTLFEGWAADLRAGRAIAPFADMGFAPVTTSMVASTIEAVLARGGPGLWQLSAPEDVTYAAAALHIARRLGAPEALVRPAEGAAAQALGGERPVPFTAFDTGRLSAELGIEPPAALRAIDACLDPAA